MLRALLLILLHVLIPAAGAAQGAAAPRALADIIDSDFAMDELWDDGLAEVATYRASRVIYGAPREHTVTLITVKEDFNLEFYTKADWPHGQKPLLPVLKQNFVTSIPTPNYHYNYMYSIFQAREEFAHCVKASFTASEWCGVTTKEFQLWHDRPVQLYQSYWDGEGTGSRRLDMGRDTFLEEELPLVLRGLPFSAGLGATLSVLPNQVTNRAPEPTPSQAVLQVSEEQAGGDWVVTLETADGRAMRFQFARDFPHIMQSMTHNDGRGMELVTVERDDYWRIGD